MTDQILNIEEMERLDRNCGECGRELNDNNRSGWSAFYAYSDTQIAIETCSPCWDSRDRGPQPASEGVAP